MGAPRVHGPAQISSMIRGVLESRETSSAGDMPPGMPPEPGLQGGLDAAVLRALESRGKWEQQKLAAW